MSHTVPDGFILPSPPLVGLTAGYPPQPGQDPPAQRQSDFIDGSGPLFQMYLEIAVEEDKKRTDSWKADADGILIFTGLFSAAVATLASVSVQDLKPNSQDISAFYLAKMYQLSADSNGSQVPIPSTLADPSIPFSPPIYAVWVNSLWFLSLVISLTCALLATLLQQWARRYVKLTQKRYSLHRRARIRAFFAEGVNKLQLPWAVEMLPALLHLSLSLFFAGLAVFLFNINHTVFKVAMSWIGICTGIYTWITFMPMFRHDSPYYAPLSFPAWYLYNGTLYTVIGIFLRIPLGRQFWLRLYNNSSAYRLVLNLWVAYRDRIKRGMEKEFEETALGRSSEFDGAALVWTFESLDEDHELEQFFAGIPGFCDSKEVKAPQSSLAKLNIERLQDVLLGFWERTLSSNLVPEPIKERRFIICVKVIAALHLSNGSWTHLCSAFRFEHLLYSSAEIGHFLITRGDNDDREIGSFAQGIIALIIAKAPQRDQLWSALTMHQLRISEYVLQCYLDHGDSILLANLIHSARRLLRDPNNPESWSVEAMILPKLLTFDVQDTLPGLQHGFCQLWNDIVLEARAARDHSPSKNILGTLHSIYSALHPDAPTTFSPSDSNHRLVLSYSLCTIPSHRLNSAFDLNELDDGRPTPTLMVTAPAPITNSPTIPRSDAGPSVIPPIANSSAPPSPTPSQDHTNPQSVDELSRSEVPDMSQRTTPAVSSPHRAPIENDDFPDGAVPGPVQGTADPSLGSSTANFDATSPGITTTIPPSFKPPDAVPPLAPIPAVSRADSAAHHASADFTEDQFDRTLYGGLVLPPSSQIAAPSLFAPRIHSDFDSNTMTETGPLGVPVDTLGQNRRIMSQSPTSSSPNITEDNLRPEDWDPSENV